MPKNIINVLEMKTSGQCSVAEKGGEIILKAADPASALQAVARQAGLQISLTPEEVKRFEAAGQFDISLRYANNRPAAIEAAKRIDQLAYEAALAGTAKSGKRYSLGKVLGLLVLAVMIGAVVFAGTVAVLDRVYGSRTLPQSLR